MTWFGHSGDIGDTIYRLPTIKAVGGGKLVLFNYPGRTYQPMTAERHATMQELIEYQPYITRCVFSEHPADTSLNGFRDHCRNGKNTAEWHLCTHGLGWEHAIDPWLELPETTRTHDVILAWTPRHHSFDFPWQRIVRAYQSRIRFLGFRDYYETFCDRYGDVDYVPADNFMIAAKIIAGSKLYCGNLTSMTAIAEGLKHNCVIEGYHPTPANDFVRYNSIIAYTERFALPCLDDL